MEKIKLKLSLVLVRALMAIKGGAVSFFSFVFNGFLKNAARGLAHFFIFPVFKLYLRLERRAVFSGNKLGYLSNQKFLLGLFLLISLVLLASQTKAYGTNKYISGRQSLLYNSLSKDWGEDGEFVEEGIEATFQEEPISVLPSGVSAPVSPAPASVAPTENIIGFNADGTAVVSPLILPGVSFGGRREIIKYVVQPGDVLGSIAQRFKISIDTILVENKITLRAPLRPGDILSILPVSGVSHKIKKGDNLAKVATLYRADKQRIIDFNNLPEDGLPPVGETIIVPEGRAPYIAPAPAPSRQQPSQTATSRPPSLITLARGMLWPTVSRRVTQYFKWRHPGLDIALPTGNPIYASDDGVVTQSGWNRGGYGYMVLIDHQNGLVTRYGHASKLFVKAGERVNKGDVIALIGSTGRSTGPHVHFEIYVNGTRVNPLYYVK